MTKTAVAVVAGFIGAAIGGGGVVLLQHPQRASVLPLSGSTTPQVSTVAVVAPTKPAVDPQPALRALQSLQSITQAGTTYQNYSAKAGDTKVEVDRYLREAPTSGQREAIELSMAYYVAASTAWGAKISNPGSMISRLKTAFGDDPRLSGCSVIKNIREDQLDSVLNALNIPPFWSCAEARLAEAEKLIGGEKK